MRFYKVFFILLVLFVHCFDALALEAVDKGKELMEGLSTKGASAIDTKDFQKPLNPEIAKWSKNLSDRLEKDSKEYKGIEISDPKVSEEQKTIAHNLVAQSKEIMSQALEVKTNNTSTLTLDDTDFYIFASFSMGEKNLGNLIKSATRYNAVVVMRGFKEGSVKETVAFLSKFIEKSGGGIIIDPELFKEYQIKRVPSFVLTKGCSSVRSEACKKEYDILEGNVSPRFVLERISRDGDLAGYAKRRI